MKKRKKCVKTFVTCVFVSKSLIVESFWMIEVIQFLCKNKQYSYFGCSSSSCKLMISQIHFNQGFVLTISVLTMM